MSGEESIGQSPDAQHPTENPESAGRPATYISAPPVAVETSIPPAPPSFVIDQTSEVDHLAMTSDPVIDTTAVPDIAEVFVSEAPALHATASPPVEQSATEETPVVASEAVEESSVILSEEIDTEFDADETEIPEVDLRSRLIGQFEIWVDQMLADEAPPPGLPENFLEEAIAGVNGDQPPADTDLYNLFSALTTLTGEIRLQGRAFKQLTDLLTPLSDTPAMLRGLREAQLQSAALSEQVLANQAEPVDGPVVPFKQVCEVMIDLFDRLQRGLLICEQGLESLQAQPKLGRIGRFFGNAVEPSDKAVLSVQALRDAGAMTLARLQAALQEWGIQRIGQIGDSFDPMRMIAVDVRADPQAAPGTVIVVNRSGYALNGTVKATAQVTVSKA